MRYSFSRPVLEPHKGNGLRIVVREDWWEYNWTDSIQKMSQKAVFQFLVLDIISLLSSFSNRSGPLVSIFLFFSKYLQDFEHYQPHLECYQQARF